MGGHNKMEITINIEKKHVFIILGAVMLLVGAYTVYAVAGVSHPSDDFVPDHIDGDFNVSGIINVQGDIILNGLPSSAPHNNLLDILCDIDERANC